MQKGCRMEPPQKCGSENKSCGSESVTFSKGHLCLRWHQKVGVSRRRNVIFTKNISFRVDETHQGRTRAPLIFGRVKCVSHFAADIPQVLFVIGVFALLGWAWLSWNRLLWHPKVSVSRARDSKF